MQKTLRNDSEREDPRSAQEFRKRKLGSPLLSALNFRTFSELHENAGWKVRQADVYGKTVGGTVYGIAFKGMRAY